MNKESAKKYMLITFSHLHIPVHAKVQYIIKLLLCDKQNTVPVNPQVREEKHPMNTLAFDNLKHKVTRLQV